MLLLPKVNSSEDVLRMPNIKHVTGQNLAVHTLDEKRRKKEKTFELCSYPFRADIRMELRV